MRQLPELYYLVFYKGYVKEKSIWEPALVIIHFCEIISTFHKNYLKKLIIISLLIDSALYMAKPTAKPIAKQLNIAKKK